MTDQFIVFELAGTAYALPSERVAHVEMVDAVTRVPNAPHFVDGVVFSRGVVVPAVSLRARFGFEREPYSSRTRLLVVHTAGRTVGLIVDSAREFIRIPADVVRPPHDSIAGPERALPRRHRDARRAHDPRSRSRRRPQPRGFGDRGGGQRRPRLTGDTVMASRTKSATNGSSHAADTREVLDQTARIVASASSLARSADDVSSGADAQLQALDSAFGGLNEMVASLQETATQADTIATTERRRSRVSVAQIAASIEQVTGNVTTLAAAGRADVRGDRAERRLDSDRDRATPRRWRPRRTEITAAMNEMVASSKSVSRDTESLTSSVTETAAAIEEVTQSIKAVSSNADDLATTAEETSSSINEMAASIEEVGAMTESLATAVEAERRPRSSRCRARCSRWPRTAVASPTSPTVPPTSATADGADDRVGRRRWPAAPTS